MTAALLPPKTKEVTERNRHWTAAEFYRAAEAGEFDDPDRLELIHGRLRRLMQGKRHADLRARISRRLRKALDPPLFPRDENPLHIAHDLELIPDFMLTDQEEYESRHPEPADVELLVEVADSSVDYDTGEKAMIYAQAGISDYWVVLTEAKAVIVFREPSASGYQSVTRLTGNETLSPLVLPEIIWTVETLIGREEAPKEN